MARREGLRAFQARLAERMQAARHEQSPNAWLSAEAGGLRVVMPLAQAGEVFPPTPARALPHAQPWFLGVANLRGNLFGVVDLASFLGLRPQVPPGLEGSLARDTQRLITLAPGLRAQCALRVDRLLGLRHVSRWTAEAEAPGAAPRPSFAPRVWRDENQGAWLELDLHALAQHPTFLAVAKTAAPAATAAA